MKTLLTCMLLIPLIGVLAAEEDLTVLPDNINGVPAKKMVSHYLRELAAQAFERRRAEYEQRTTPLR